MLQCNCKHTNNKTMVKSIKERMGLEPSISNGIVCTESLFIDIEGCGPFSYINF